MVRNALTLTLVLLAIPIAARAQTNGDSAVRVGQRVRLKIEGETIPWRHGNVTSISADTIWLASQYRATPLAVPRRSIRQLEVSQGSRSHFLQGLAIGLAGGALIGGAIGFASGDDPPCEGFFCFRYSAEEKAGAGALIGGVLGAALGGVVGAATKSERWAAVRPTSLRLTAQTNGGLALIGSYRF